MYPRDDEESNRGGEESGDVYVGAGRDAEETVRQVRPQDPAGDQKAVHQESQGEKIAQSQFLAHGHPGSRDDLALLVPAVLRRQEHRHVHDVRPRESGGLHVELLLLRRVRGEPEEREQRERDDNLTSVSLSDTTRWFCLVLSKFAGESSCRVSEGVAKRIAMAILIPIYLTLNQ